jgi:2-haloacid dehalogenase
MALTAPIKVLTFDTGGTILDWHGRLSAALAAVGGRRGIVADWPAVTNEYRRRTLKGIARQVRPGFNIDDVHSRVLDELVAEFGWAAFTEEERSEIERARHALDAWPDFPPALVRLRRSYVAAGRSVSAASVTKSQCRPKPLRESEGCGTCGARQQHCSHMDSRPWCSG